MDTILAQDIEKFTLPNHARVWIFQSDRLLITEEVEALIANGKRFAAQWKAHGKGLTAEFEVIHNLFVVMAIDEEMEGASGCSIDTFMRFVLEAETQMGLNLTNRLCFALEYENQVLVCKREDAKSLVGNGVLTPETLVFDNLIKTLGELRTSWLKPAQSLWVKQFIKA